MVILHLTTFLQGGAGLVIASLAAAQRAAGHEVVVVTSATGAPGYGNYTGHLAYLAAAGVAVHVVDSLFSRAPGDWEPVLATLLADPRACEAHVCHAHAATPSRIALAFEARTRPRPVVQTMHGWGIGKSEAQARADVEVMNRVAAVVVPAQTSAVLLGTLGVDPSRVRRIAYGVAPRGARMEPAHDVEAEMRDWRAAGALVLCCPGTVGARKNQRALLQALAALESSGMDVRCVFVGEGETAALVEHAAALGILARVRVCGYRVDARHITAAADHLVLPSLSEGQPLAVLEAFADGVPVILSDIPEHAELVGDRIPRLLFDPHDPADIARTIAAAASLSPQERARLAHDARQAWLAQFSIDGMTAAYDSVYRGVLPA